jgi:hypothetical protein
MATINRTLIYEGSQGAKSLKTSFSSDTTISCISPEAIEGLANAKKLYRPLQVQKDSIEQFLSIEYAICVDFYIDDVRLSDEFYVIPGLSEDAILGVNTFQKWRIKLDFEHDTVIVDPKVAKAMLK